MSLVRRLFKIFANPFTRPNQGVPAQAAPPAPLSPVPHSTNPSFAPSQGQPIERNYEREYIYGTPIATGSEEHAMAAATGELVTGRDTVFIACGCGHLVSRIEPANSLDVVHRGVGGLCPCCEEEAASLLEQGQIDLFQARAHSMACSECIRRCDGCGRSVCARHCRPFDLGDGVAADLCPECASAAGRKKFVKGFLGAVASSFLRPPES